MAPRAAIYARYSSDKQSDRSIEDQVALCRSYAEKADWRIVDIFSDAAMSGTTSHRPEYRRLLESSQHGRFDIVLAESLDRISRDQEDIHHFYKRITFRGVELHTVADGKCGSMHVGLKGIIAAQYIEDLANKTRRGLAGRVRAGRSAGGLCFGYDVVREFDDNGEVKRGRRSINPYEAEIVIRIFEAYASGQSSKAIAKQLNRERIPSPRGGMWNASTIVGNPKRGNGILNNELYIGRLVWNRQRFIKDPDSGKRVAVPNDESDWIVQEVPELRLVSDDLWTKVKSVQKEMREYARRAGGKNPARFLRGPRHILSGQLICVQCLGKYVSVERESWRCGDHVMRGTCDNPMGLHRKDLERPVYEALKSVFYGPLCIKLFGDRVLELIERNEHVADWGAKQAAASLRQIDKKIANIIGALEDGQESEVLVKRLSELEAERNSLRSTLFLKNVPINSDDLDMARLFQNALDKLPEIIADRSRNRRALRMLNASFTNRSDWWNNT